VTGRERKKNPEKISFENLVGSKTNGYLICSMNSNTYVVFQANGEDMTRIFLGADRQPKGNKDFEPQCRQFGVTART